MTKEDKVILKKTKANITKNTDIIKHCINSLIYYKKADGTICSGVIVKILPFKTETKSISTLYTLYDGTELEACDIYLTLKAAKGEK